jgi:LEA14-like dessication related protein
MRRILWLLPLLAGCALLRSLVSSAFERPTIAFKEARVPSIDFQGAELDLVFAVTNPNSMGLDLAKATYALQIEGKQVVAGAPQNGLAIPAHGTAEVTFPARVLWTGIAPALEALFAQGQVHYKATGELGVNSPIGLVTLPVSHEGTFSAPKMPKLEIGSPRITGISLTGAHLQIPLKIANGNGFPLPLGGVLGDVELAGSKVGHVALSETAPVPAGQEATLLIPLEVNFLSAGQAVTQAIRTGVAEVKLDVTLNAGGAMLPFKIARTVELQR